MAENSGIEWTDNTFNPWMGCTKVSPACQNCYAERDFDHRYGKVNWGPKGTRVKTSDANWRKPLKWNREAEKDGGRLRVFCASLADVFGPKARTAEPDWYRSLRDQCRETETPFHFKQWGEWLPMNQFPTGTNDLRGVEVTGPPHAFWARVGKKKAGRLLDGETHDGLPLVEVG